MTKSRVIMKIFSSAIDCLTFSKLAEYKVYTLQNE